MEVTVVSGETIQKMDGKQFLAHLAFEQKKSEETEQKRKEFNASVREKTFEPNLVEYVSTRDKTPTTSAALCPTCKNVELRFIVSEYMDFSSMSILQKYASSGYDLQCLCCRTNFKFCSGDFNIMGYYPHPPLNCVFITRETMKHFGIDA